jgi:hypothetical protein
MQSLADLARRDHSMVPEALDLLRIHTRSGTPAMRARGRKLLKILEPAGVESSARNRSRRAPYPG